MGNYKVRNLIYMLSKIYKISDKGGYYDEKVIFVNDNICLINNCL